MITLYDSECFICGSTGTTMIQHDFCIKCNGLLQITERQVSDVGWYKG